MERMPYVEELLPRVIDARDRAVRLSNELWRMYADRSEDFSSTEHPRVETSRLLNAVLGVVCLDGPRDRSCPGESPRNRLPSTISRRETDARRVSSNPDAPECLSQMQLAAERIAATLAGR
jgi:hypothetical protein